MLPACNPSACAIKLSANQQILYCCWAMQNLQVDQLSLSILGLPQSRYVVFCLSLALVQIVKGTLLPPFVAILALA